MVAFGNILDDTVVFSCIDIMLQTNNAIHLGRDPSLLLCGSTLCGQVMAALVCDFFYHGFRGYANMLQPLRGIFAFFPSTLLEMLFGKLFRI